MPSPSFIDYFNSAYATWSVRVEKLSIPRHFDVYYPDDPNDTGCRMVLLPSPRKGAHNYTRDGKFLLIGVYRDTGRPDVAHPVVSNVSWTRTNNLLTITDTVHEADVGDWVYVYNTNIVGEQRLQVHSVTETTFTVKTNALIGNNSGVAGGYRLDKIKKFAEENVVFRILPSFKLVPYTEILALFSSTDPNTTAVPEYIRNITTNALQIVSNKTDPVVDYTPSSHLSNISDVSSTLPKITITKPDRMTRQFEHSQQFDEAGNALPLRFDEAGRVIDPDYYDKANKNARKHIAPLLVPTNELNPYVFDFYGYLINDATRGPANIADVVVQGIDTDIVHTTLNGAPIYPLTQKVYDIFGNEVIGITEAVKLIVTKQRLPLELDNFGKPKKLPVG